MSGESHREQREHRAAEWQRGLPSHSRRLCLALPLPSLSLAALAVAWIVAGCFALLSGAITTLQIYKHLKFNTNGDIRRYIIRIILMVNAEHREHRDTEENSATQRHRGDDV